MGSEDMRKKGNVSQRLMWPRWPDDRLRILDRREIGSKPDSAKMIVVYLGDLVHVNLISKVKRLAHATGLNGKVGDTIHVSSWPSGHVYES
ncbi:hypothetical protein AVEN_177407-1 [Araneus ventricosus]|uniref:Uncharacterized protein n=1 Tax=Araneus ventricosus TaxID=182803 RepID=A0A4Y2VHC7_ARAVE|nr:hypothetical protein AVEN_256283-1 [Araneus ventricosus]GBO24294.1 hypothetical protein AVEN_177407-1 [Araneus ventricosus]